LVTDHLIAFGGLSSTTVYHYRVRSKDAAGNLSISGDFTFTTPGGSDTTSPVITGVTASTTGSTATIVWNTNEASDTQVQYGATSTYDSTTGLISSMVTSHSALISGLSAGTSPPSAPSSSRCSPPSPCRPTSA
jgi:hypothetical protein